jgi:hypothetical protein
MLRIAECVPDCVRLAISQTTEWQRIGNQIDAAMPENEKLHHIVLGRDEAVIRVFYES